jgi:hypothetical protein
MNAELRRLSVVKIRFGDGPLLYVVCMVVPCNIHMNVNVCIYIFLAATFLYLQFMCSTWLRGLCCLLPVRVGSVPGAVIPALFMFCLCRLYVWGRVVWCGEWIHYWFYVVPQIWDCVHQCSCHSLVIRFYWFFICNIFLMCLNMSPFDLFLWLP